MHGLHKLLYFNRLRGHGIRIADSVYHAEVAGNIAHCPRQGTLAPRTLKPPKATAKPYSRHILGIYCGVQSHPKATLKPPYSHPKATSKRHQSHLDRSHLGPATGHGHGIAALGDGYRAAAATAAADRCQADGVVLRGVDPGYADAGQG